MDNHWLQLFETLIDDPYQWEAQAKSHIRASKICWAQYLETAKRVQEGPLWDDIAKYI